MKKRILLGALFAGATFAVVATTALGGSSKQGATPLPASSCGKLQYKSGGSPRFIVASDLPLQGAGRSLRTEMNRAMAFVLSQQGWKAGNYTLGFQACDDSTPATGAWDSAKCTANATAYAGNKAVIGVIGTFNSGCAKLEIPIENRAPGGPLGMISPSNTYPGLTVGGPGTAPGEPNVYYPTGKRSYARVVWTDQFQGAADAIFSQTYMHLKNPFVLTDGQTYGLGIATLYQRAMGKLGLTTSGFQKWDPNASSYESIVSAIKTAGSDGVFLGGLICLNGGKLLKDLRAGLGADFPILMPDGFTPFSATGQTSGGASDGAYISYPGLPVTQISIGKTGKALKESAGQKFVRGFAKVNGGKLPDPYTAYAAQAMQVMLGSIAKSNGTRGSVAAGLFGLNVTNGILGNFKIDKNGDTTLGTVTFGRMKGENATFIKLITPPLKLVKG